MTDKLVTTTNEDTAPETMPKPPQTKAKKIIIIAIIVAVVLAGIGVTLYFILSKKTPEPTPPVPQNIWDQNPYKTTQSIEHDYLLSYSNSLQSHNNTDDDVKESADNKEITEINCNITSINEYSFRILYTSATERFEIGKYAQDYDVDFTEITKYQKPKISDKSLINITQSPFAFDLKDKRTGSTMVSTKGNKFRFMEKYISFEITFPGDRLYGIGERVGGLLLLDGNYSIYNKGKIDDISEEYKKNSNSFGTHPFILGQLTNNQYVGYFMANLYPMNIQISTTGHGKIIVFRTIGGVIDFRVIGPGTADFIIKRYHGMIGRPPLLPLWALGVHHLINESNEAAAAQIVQNYESNDLPLEAVWLGCNYNEDKEPFTFDKKKYPNSDSVFTALHKKGIKVIPCVVPSIPKKADGRYMKMLEDNKLGILTQSNGDLYIGKTRDGDSAFIDFFNTDTYGKLWSKGLEELFSVSKFDGLWMDWNEITTYDTNKNTPLTLPYTPPNLNLQQYTLPLAAYHSQAKATEYDLHNLNSLAMAENTYNYLNSINKRVFLSSRATTISSGKYTSHIHQSPEYSQEYIKNIIPLLIQNQMFGLQLSGVEGCTLSNDELCLRWEQIALACPLSRTPGSDIMFEDMYSRVMRTNSRRKYNLLRYYYTVLFEKTLYGGAAITPVSFKFPDDEVVADYSDKSFMIGDSLLLTPSLEKDSKKLYIYFPNAHWYNLDTGLREVTYSEGQPGGFVDIEADLDKTPTFILGGHIIPYQNALGAKVQRVAELSDLNTTLLVALDHNNKSFGTMIIDDGVNPNVIKEGAYRHYEFTFSNKVLKVNRLSGFYDEPNYQCENFTTIQILGAQNLSDTISACYFMDNMGVKDVTVKYDKLTGILTLSEMNKRPVPLSKIESFVIVGYYDYDICRGRLFAQNVTLTENYHKIEADLVSKDQAALRYSFSAMLSTSTIINAKITPKERNAWQVPNIIPESFTKNSTSQLNFYDQFFGISHDPDNFYFRLTEPGDPYNFVLSCELLPIFSKPHFVYLRAKMKATKYYGLGERNSNFSLGYGRYSAYAYNNKNGVDYGTGSGKNKNSQHSFIMYQLVDGTYGGFFLLSSNSIEVMFMDFTTMVIADFIISGGILDMYIINRDTAENVIKQYHDMIGKPMLPPYWSFGYQIGSNYYGNAQGITDFYAAHKAKSIPIDGLWIGKEYMKDSKAFNGVEDSFKDIGTVVSSLKDANIKVVAMVHPAISKESDAYTLGDQYKAFIMSQNNVDYTTGMGYGGYSTYIDFFHPNATKYTNQLLSKLTTQIAYDGLWLDMNEIENLCDGDCALNPNPFIESQVSSSYDDLPYLPTHRNLQKNALSLDAIHYGNPEISTEYNVHSMNGYLQSKAVYSELSNLYDQRPFILSRSTFAGSGKYSSHISQHIPATWEQLGYSIASIYDFQLFGLSQSGTDVCGSYVSDDIELCQRWYQLAAFYPIMRYLKETKETPLLISNEQVLKTAKAAITQRYNLLRHIYTQAALFNLKHSTYFKPLFYSFPGDALAEKCNEKSFLIGPIKVTPILEKGKSSVVSYFPNSNWYDLATGAQIAQFGKSGTNITLDGSLESNKINMHIMGGHIVPLQNSAGVMNVEELQKKKAELIVALDHSGSAQGVLYYDEGDSSNQFDDYEYHLYAIFANGHDSPASIKMEVKLIEGDKYKRSSEYLDETIEEIKIYGAGKYSLVKYACIRNGSDIKLINISYDSTNKVLTLNLNGGSSLLEMSSILVSEINICS